MASENKILDLTFEAAEDLSDDQYRFVVLTSTGTVRRPDSATEVPIGILQNAPESGGAASVRVQGVSKLQANAALAINLFVKAEYVSAADAGKGTTSVGSEEYARAIVLEAAAAEDDLCSVLLVPPRPAIAIASTEIALVEGSIIVGDNAGAGSAVDAKTNGNVLYGDGTTLVSGTPDTAGLVAKTGDQTVAGNKTFSEALKTGSGNGAKNGAEVVAAEYGDGVIHKTVLTCTEVPISFGDEAGQGQYGGTKVYDFPGGLIGTIGATIDGEITLSAPAIDLWNGDIGLGLEAPTDHQDGANKTGQIMPKVSTTQAVAKVANVDAQSVATVLTESGARWLDGTTTAKDLFLNLLVDDDALHDNTIAGTFTGTITVVWINLGDNK